MLLNDAVSADGVKDRLKSEWRKMDGMTEWVREGVSYVRTNHPSVNVEYNSTVINKHHLQRDEIIYLDSEA